MSLRIVSSEKDQAGFSDVCGSGHCCFGGGDLIGVIVIPIMSRGQTINSDPNTQIIKRCTDVSGEFEIIDTLLKLSFNIRHSHKQVWKHRKQLKNSVECSSPLTINSRNCSLRFAPLWNPQRRHHWGKIWEWWRGYWAVKSGASIKFKFVQKGTDVLVTRWRKAAEFYGEYVDTLFI